MRLVGSLGIGSVVTEEDAVLTVAFRLYEKTKFLIEIMGALSCNWSICDYEISFSEVSRIGKPVTKFLFLVVLLELLLVDYYNYSESV